MLPVSFLPRRPAGVPARRLRPRSASASLRRALALAAVAVLATACDDDDPVTAPPRVDTAALEAEVRAAVARLDGDWASRDAARYAANFATDAVFVGAIGVPQVGRDAVQAAHVTLFGGPFANTTRRARVDRVTILGPTVATIESTVSLSGFPPGTTEILGGALRLTCPAQGEVQTRELAVAERRTGGWTLVRVNLVPIAATPPGPPTARPTCPLP